MPNLTFEAPRIGRIVAITVILAFLGYSVVRAFGYRPPAAPNSAMPLPAIDEPLAKSPSTETAVFAGGCFWGVQSVFEHIKGVTKATAGYSGGYLKDPSYEAVSTGATGHAESVQVTFDPSQITFGQLLMVYFSVVHDPTQLNRQGPDTGSQYRSAIFYSTDEQKRIADAYVAQISAAHIYNRAIVTKIEKFSAFYPAEGYHQDYAKNFPNDTYIQINDAPKLRALIQQFPAMCLKD